MKNKYLLFFNKLISKENRWRANLLILLIILGGFVEFFGIYLILPLSSFVINNEKSIFFQFDYISDLKLSYSNDELLFFLIIGFVIVFYIRSIYLVLLNYFQYSFLERTQTDMSKNLISINLNKTWKQWINQNTSKVLQNVINDTAIFTYQFVLPILTLLSEFFFITIFLCYFLYNYPLETLIFISLMILIFFTYYYIFVERIVKRIAKIRWENDDLRIKHLNEIIQNFKELKIFGVGKIFLSKFLKVEKIHNKALKTMSFFSQMPRFFIEVVSITVLSFSFIYIISDASVSLKDQVPKLVFFVALLVRMLPSVNRIINSFQLIKFALPSVKYIYEEKSYIESFVETNNQTQISFQNNISLKNISFSHPGKNIFQDISLEIKKNSIVGIVGMSGSGKTTLINLLSGIIEPEKGKIFIDDIELNNTNLMSWQNKLAMLSQNSLLLDDSILNNIIFGHNKVDKNLLEKVIKECQLTDFIKNLEQGVETIIGEKGSFISAGQIQRIALARTLYFQRDILVLDEITNALDEKTEDQIIDLLKSLKNKKTIIIISHNKKNLRICDEVFSIKNNKVLKL